MLLSLAEKVANFFISRHLIPDSDRDWAIYALQRYILAAIFYPILFLIGCFCSSIITTSIFFLAFTGLRHRIGGHHAQSPLRCFAVSICILIIGLFLYPKLTLVLPKVFDAIICFTAGAFIWVIGPCKDPRMQMTLREYQTNRKQSRFIIFIVWICTAVLLLYPDFRIYAKAVTAAVVLAAALLIAGIFQIGGTKNEQSQQHT